MTSRTIIGQAEGILMERLGIDADQAFAYLRSISQAENRKLIMISRQIVETRRLPR
jgi:AmiR/NasT family two-component response regulator